MFTSIGLLKHHPAGKIATVGQKRFVILGNCKDDRNKPCIITSYDKDRSDYQIAELYQVIKFLDIVPDVRKIIERGDRPFFFLIPYYKISDVKDKSEISKVFICEKCGKVISSRQRDSNNNYIQLCADCLKAHYVFVDSILYKKQDVISISSGGSFSHYITKKDYLANLTRYETCPLCKNIFAKRNNNHYCNYEIQPYGLKFSKQVTKDLKPNVRYFGIEHEVFSNDSESFAKTIKENYQGLFMTKADGSVDGIEIVSRPLTYEFLESFNWGEYMQICKDYGYEKDGAGIHIHISKSSLSKGDEMLILKFFAYNYNNILRFTKRTEDSINNWAYIGDGIDLPKRLFDNQYNKSTSHSCALNTSNSNTDEFRIFSSTLSQRQFKANYQFVNALINYVKQLKTFDLAFKSFCNYVSKLQGHSSLKYVIERSI